MTSLNSLGRQLADGLTAASRQENSREQVWRDSEKINIVGAGKALTAAYEQLRNAAENVEEHLLLQNAIKRFYKQLFIMRDEAMVGDSGSELAIELTLAGYLANDTLAKPQIDQISRLAVDHYAAYEDINLRRGANQEKAFGWLLDTLAVSVEGVINQHYNDTAFVDFSYHYLTTLIPEGLIKGRKKADYSAELFVSIHRALLKSDSAIIRTQLLARYGVSVRDVTRYLEFNKRIDALIESPTADKLYHITDRQGAVLRIIRRMIEERSDFIEILPRRGVFLEAYEQQVRREYSRVSTRINRAIVRSVIFLVVTKFIIGIAIEIPYDIWAHGEIIWSVLAINLFFPPVYMVLLRLTHTLPGYANTTAMVDRIDAMLYGEKITLMKKQLSAKHHGAVFSVVYTALSIAVIIGLIYCLLLLGFSMVHIAIFFVFFSAASFLGFRLSRLIREIEVVRSSSNGLTIIRDLVYLPFVVIGRWMSDKYSKVNVVTIVLDMLIELPLKTVLRLIRQWSAFIDDRKDHIS